MRLFGAGILSENTAWVMTVNQNSKGLSFRVITNISGSPLKCFKGFVSTFITSLDVSYVYSGGSLTCEEKINVGLWRSCGSTSSKMMHNVFFSFLTTYFSHTNISLRFSNPVSIYLQYTWMGIKKKTYKSEYTNMSLHYLNVKTYRSVIANDLWL